MNDSAIHDSVARLLECAVRSTSGLPASRRVIDLTSLRQRMGWSSARLTNYKKRGLAEGAALDAEKLFNCSAAWLLGKTPTDWMQPQAPSGGVVLYPVAQNVSHLAREHAPMHIEWEQLMKSTRAAEFQTVAPDDAMSPDVPAGAKIIFITGTDPRPGDFVLVADAQGHHYFREYKTLRPDHWQAHARNAAFLPLDSLRDGLKVVAVFDGMRGRRSVA